MNIRYTYLYIMSQSQSPKEFSKSRTDPPPAWPKSPEDPPPAWPKSPDDPPPAWPKSPDDSPPVRPDDGRPSEKKKADERAPNSKADFETMVEFYLADNPYLNTRGKVSELEVRFGTNPKSARPLSKINYDNVVQQFYSAGFSTNNPEGLSILRINSEETDRKTGQYRMSNIRAEVMGVDLIQEYCRTNNLQKLIDLPSTSSAVADKIKFTKKEPPFIGETRDTSKPLKAVDFPDHNFRVSYQYERDFGVRSEVAKRILSKWTDAKKTFRYINRVRLAHPDYPVFVDISVLKGSSKTARHVPIPQYTVQEAAVFTNPESYEVELELDNNRVGPGTPFTTMSKLMMSLRKCIRIVLSGLQGTNYPIAYSERDKVLHMYMQLIFGQEYAIKYMEQLLSSNDRTRDFAKRKLNSHFTGPSSYTLQMAHVAPLPDDGKERTSTLPNIRDHYTVTDKADGDRKLLYIAPNGRIYMIDTNMNVIFTGTMTQVKELFDSLLDGEHIKYDKMGKYVNLYAAFDVYYINGKSKRELNFMAIDEDAEPSKFRLNLLNSYIRALKPRSIMDVSGGNSDPKKKMSEDQIEEHACHFRIKCKEFYSSQNGGIFKGCSDILSKVRDGTYEYTTDGLIFTPASTGVGGERSGHAGTVKKMTWPLSFKWKPAEYNTIDFLVSVKKDKTGKEEVHHVFQDGTNMTSSQNLMQYKTIVLRCGFNRRDHGYVNPMLDMINDQLPSPGDKDNEQFHQPVAFQPTNPYDPNASLCNVELSDNGTGGMVMMTKENEYFEEDMIVEFSYDKDKVGAWKWVPLRVRYDKTNDLRSGGQNYGNAYHVANSNWRSIHHPITEDMISTGMNIPSDTMDEDVYYNRAGKDTSTKALRNFHNLYVKRKLILGASNRGNTLIDYAVGKAGDLPKWLAANIDFVFGIDVSKDNIENQLDGACARYLNLRRKYTKMPGALFVNGNSGRNIRDGKALISEKDKQIAKAVFGQGPKDKTELGAGVYKWYGIGEDGFNVSSCQFALHYFFESERTMHAFLRNVAECTKVNGYFIGTCYDGQTVFNLLKNKEKEQGMTIMRDEQKMFEITKQYDYTGFPEDEYSLGYAVDVYQESINKVFREYLVNFKYLERVMENYGFTVIGEEEAKAMHLPDGSGLFSELYEMMNAEIQQNRNLKSEYESAPDMTNEEKRVSFLNRYFVFRKTHNVNAEKASKLMMRHLNAESDEDAAAIIQRTQKEDAALDNVIESNSTIRKLSGKKVQITIGPSLDTTTTPSNEIQLLEATGKKVVIRRAKKD
jgi:hypothetical protein